MDFGSVDINLRIGYEFRFIQTKMDKMNELNINERNMIFIENE